MPQQLRHGILISPRGLQQVGGEGVAERMQRPSEVVMASGLPEDFAQQDVVPLVPLGGHAVSSAHIEGVLVRSPTDPWTGRRRARGAGSPPDALARTDRAHHHIGAAAAGSPGAAAGAGGAAAASGALAASVTTGGGARAPSRSWNTT